MRNPATDGLNFDPVFHRPGDKVYHTFHNGNFFYGYIAKNEREAILKARTDAGGVGTGGWTAKIHKTY